MIFLVADGFVDWMKTVSDLFVFDALGEFETDIAYYQCLGVFQEICAAAGVGCLICLYPKRFAFFPLEEKQAGRMSVLNASVDSSDGILF
jgi:hypothetical protein